jgi:hypothetical protein
MSTTPPTPGQNKKLSPVLLRFDGASFSSWSFNTTLWTARPNTVTDRHPIRLLSMWIEIVIGDMMDVYWALVMEHAKVSYFRVYV